MRVISWTVILGAVSALFFGWVRPFVPEIGFPPVDPTQVAGSTVATTEDDVSECIETASDDIDSGETPPQEDQESCDESRLAQQ